MSWDVPQMSFMGFSCSKELLWLRYVILASAVLIEIEQIVTICEKIRSLWTVFFQSDCTLLAVGINYQTSDFFYVTCLDFLTWMITFSFFVSSCREILKRTKIDSLQLSFWKLLLHRIQIVTFHYPVPVCSRKQRLVLGLVKTELVL